MSEFDWRSPETYAKLQTAEADDFAWECLRRNSDYREDYRIRQNSGKSTTSQVDGAAPATYWAAKRVDAMG